MRCPKPYPGSMSGRRKYDRHYVAARKRMTPQLRAGVPCARCGLLVDDSMPAQLDHLSDNPNDLAWSHARCNMSAGGKIGGKIRAAQRARPLRPCCVCGLPFKGSKSNVVTCGNPACVARLRASRRAWEPDPVPQTTPAGRVW